MIRNLQVLAIALLVSSVSLAFGQAKVEVDDNAKVGAKSVVGDDGSKGNKTAATGVKAKMKPGKEKKVYVGESHEKGKKPAASRKEKKRGGWFSRLVGGQKNSDDEDNPRKKK